MIYSLCIKFCYPCWHSFRLIALIASASLMSLSIALFSAASFKFFTSMYARVPPASLKSSLAPSYTAWLVFFTVPPFFIIPLGSLMPLVHTLEPNPLGILSYAGNQNINLYAIECMWSMKHTTSMPPAFDRHMTNVRQAYHKFMVNISHQAWIIGAQHHMHPSTFKSLWKRCHEQPSSCRWLQKQHHEYQSAFKSC